MKSSMIILMCENCNKGMAETEIPELNIPRYEIFIKEGSVTKRNHDDSNVHIGGYYCSSNCLVERINTQKETQPIP